MRLTIITPYYNTYEYTKELAKVLEPQLTDDIEWIIVDDGCNETRLDNFKAKVIHLKENSGGASKPRNIGLDNARGDYIAFIDSDDLVVEDYIGKIIKAITKNVDIIYLSWKSKVHEVKITTRPPKWNCAVWCRVYKKEIIKNIRFDEKLRIAEDWKFNQEIRYNSSICIKTPVYIYNNGRKGSLING